MYWIAPLIGLAAAVVAQGQIQTFLSPAEHSDLTNSLGFELSAIAQQDAYVALTHRRFPAHQVRVKKTAFCDPTVKYVLYQLTAVQVR